MLAQRVSRILEDHGFEYQEYSGCFDLFARKGRETLLLKVLSNVDSFQESQAGNLKLLSHNLGAFACLIGEHTRYEKLEDGVVYERFDIPTLTANSFGQVLDNKSPHTYRARGGLFAEVEPSRLRKARERKGWTQKQLADRIGITKKSLYEHESKRMKALQETVEKIEKILKEDLTMPFNFKIEISNVVSSPKSQFEKSVGAELQKMGFKTDFVYQTPFNIIAKERLLILNEAEENEKKIKRNIPNLIEFSKISDKPILVITKDRQEFELPSVEKKELKDLTAKDLKKIIKKW